jgi:hypothetical protein
MLSAALPFVCKQDVSGTNFRGINVMNAESFNVMNAESFILVLLLPRQLASYVLCLSLLIVGSPLSDES